MGDAEFLYHDIHKSMDMLKFLAKK